MSHNEDELRYRIGQYSGQCSLPGEEAEDLVRKLAPSPANLLEQAGALEAMARGRDNPESEIMREAAERSRQAGERIQNDELKVRDMERKLDEEVTAKEYHIKGDSSSYFRIPRQYCRGDEDLPKFVQQLERENAELKEKVEGNKLFAVDLLKQLKGAAADLRKDIKQYYKGKTMYGRRRLPRKAINNLLAIIDDLET